MSRQKLDCSNSGKLFRRYRKRGTATVWHYSPWCQEAEPGDLMVTDSGQLYRLQESSGWGKRKAGELTLRLILPPMHGLIAKIVGEEVWWVKSES